ncbi:MAG: VWA domain-containing protein [Oscillospiraceae bacterium]|nr:VWA domain-containing protein [Oscillospiraceae bacterium]
MENIRRWRLILGECAEAEFAPPLTGDDEILDGALAAIYDKTSGFSYGGKDGTSGKSVPFIAKWLGDIRRFFPEETLVVIQNDAINRQNMTQLLTEPELLKTVTPDINLVTMLISLKHKIPERAKDAARQAVREATRKILKEIEPELRQSVSSATRLRAHSPVPSSVVDWHATVKKNLGRFDKERKALIPEKLVYFRRGVRQNPWRVILALDQSGSMAESAVYASLAGCVLASLPSIKTHVVAFDAQVADLTESCLGDPVDLLFGLQIGGGTDIGKALAYCAGLATVPERTLLILISDLYEGGSRARFYGQMKALTDLGVKCVCLLALSDKGRPRFDEANAKALAEMGVPCFAAAPGTLSKVIASAINSR